MGRMTKNTKLIIDGIYMNPLEEIIDFELFKCVTTDLINTVYNKNNIYNLLELFKNLGIILDYIYIDDMKFYYASNGNEFVATTMLHRINKPLYTYNEMFAILSFDGDKTILPAFLAKYFDFNNAELYFEWYYKVINSKPAPRISAMLLR